MVKIYKLQDWKKNLEKLKRRYNNILLIVSVSCNERFKVESELKLIIFALYIWEFLIILKFFFFFKTDKALRLKSLATTTSKNFLFISFSTSSVSPLK